MFEFMLECIVLTAKVTIGVSMIALVVVGISIPCFYLKEAARDRLEDWDFRHEFDVWRLRNK